MKTSLKIFSIFVFTLMFSFLSFLVVGCKKTTKNFYTATFVVDNHASVLVYDTINDLETARGGVRTTEAYTKDGETGEFTKTDGQIAFRVVCEDGYIVSKVLATEATYESLEICPNNGFVLTQVSADTTIAVAIEECTDFGDESYTTTQTISSTYDSSAISLDITPAEGTSFKYLKTTASVLRVELSSETKNAEITLEGAYNGGLEITTTSNAGSIINFNSVTIYVSEELPALYIKQADSCEISVKKDTTNYIYDNRSAAKNLSAAIYSDCDMDFKGKGTLNVSSVNNNGIHTKGDLRCKNLTLNVSCLDNALKGNDSIKITSGTYNLTASKGDAIKTKNGSLKSDGVTRKGFVTISEADGKTLLTINSLADGIDAAYDVNILAGTINITTTGNLTNKKSLSYVSSAKGIKTNNQINITGGDITITSTDDGLHADYGDLLDEDSETDREEGVGEILIEDGSLFFDSRADAVHADNTLTISGGIIYIIRAVEGLEGNFINISGGDITIYAVEDGLNAPKKIGQTPVITISGGKLDITVGNGDTDGIDSNGNYVQTGGLVITRGPTSSNHNMASLDVGGTASISGGTLITLGVSEPIEQSGSVYSVKFGLVGGAGGQSGHSIATGVYSIALDSQTIEFDLMTSHLCMAIYSDDLTLNESYNVVKDHEIYLSWVQSSPSITETQI